MVLTLFLFFSKWKYRRLDYGNPKSTIQKRAIAVEFVRGVINYNANETNSVYCNSVTL